MKKILALIYKLDPKVYVITILCAMVEALNGFGMILLSSVLLNRLMTDGSLSEVFGLTVVLACGYGILYFAMLGLQQWRMHRVERLTLIYRRMVTEKIFAVPFDQLERVEFTELLSEIRNNDSNYMLLSLSMDNVYWILTSIFSIGVAVISFVELFGVIQLLGDSAFLVSMLVLLIFILVIGSTGYIAWRKKENAKMLQKLDQDLVHLNVRSQALYEVMNDYPWGKYVRIDQMHERLLQEWDRMQVNAMDLIKHFTNLDLGVNNLANISSNVISGLIYVTVGVVALAGGLGVGSIIWYAGIVQRLLESIRKLVFDFGNLQSNCIRQQPLFELLSIASEAYTGSGEENATRIAPYAIESQDVSSQSHVIEFDDVSFAYPDTDRMILEHVNLRLSGQERIALVGRNGCGKSTLIKLICRLYDPTEGRILLDGVDIRTIPRQEYVKMLSIVFQDFHIFADSLAGNIAMSDTVDRARAAEIVKRVGLGISDLDQPLLRHLEEDGIEVSGGEGQKIAIARALYKDAPMVILDEPTAALDPLSESEIYKKFNLLVDGKMALFISHRLSSCRFCNRILVLQDGDIIQDGSHEELVAADGLYQQMWNAQKQYYV